MAIDTHYEKWERLMVWACGQCSEERGYLEPRTTKDTRAFLECEACRKHTEHVRTGRVREFKVMLQH